MTLTTIKPKFQGKSFFYFQDSSMWTHILLMMPNGLMNIKHAYMPNLQIILFS